MFCKFSFILFLIISNSFHKFNSLFLINESTYSSIPLRYISLMRHSPLLNRNESTYSSIPLRSISLMRHSPHHIKNKYFFLKASFHRNICFLWYVASLLTHKKARCSKLSFYCTVLFFTNIYNYH